MARLLHLTTPHLHGADVHTVQLELRRHKLNPGPIDGDYGPSTAAAVRQFQREHRLPVDGIVGPKTLTELVHGPAAQLPAPSLPGREPPGHEALGWMRARLGMKEDPAGSNRCPVTAEFRLVGPWCMEAVSLAFKHGAGIILGDETPAPWQFWPDRGFAYVPAFEAWATARGYYAGRRTPIAGDVVTYNWGGPIAAHVGVVERWIGGGQFDALEGNTGLGNDSNGGELMRRRRYVSQLHGVYRITRHLP